MALEFDKDACLVSHEEKVVDWTISQNVLEKGNLVFIS